jgi:predicted lipoprotein with Yx(FWY)xxD motif
MRAKIAVAITVAATVAAVLIPASLAGPSRDSGATVSVRQSTLGRILVDGRGHTLYLFEKDTRGRSTCNGACAAGWPPLIASGQARAGTGATPSLLGRTKRKDGRWQVTYNHHPLYAFVEDTRRGQTNGEGLNAYGAEWYAVSPGGVKVEQDSSMSNASDPAPAGSGGYSSY